MNANKIQRAVRRPEDKQALRQKPSDPALVVDSVTAAIEGYFHLPAVWVGKEPPQDSVLNLNEQVHHEVVLTKTLECGIDVRVQRDCTFWFDFAMWPLAPQIEIPGYRIPNTSKPYRLPRSHSEAEKRAEAYAVIRAKVMNVHQACLTSFDASMRGFPVTAWNTEKAISWRALRHYYDDVEDLHALARNVFNNSYKVHRDSPLRRWVTKLDVVERSLELLDKILLPGDPNLIQIVETIFMAACRNRDKRFGEALTLSWSVCEQIMFRMWEKFLNDPNKQPSGNRILKKRRKKLLGLTASNLLETLELTGVLDDHVYQKLDTCRLARNKWIHKLILPEKKEAYTCIQAAESLLHQHYGIPLHLQPGGRGGVPSWNMWVWDQVVQQERKCN